MLRFSLILAVLGGLAVEDGDRKSMLSVRDHNRFLFFAVLEGLSRDSVPDELVGKLLETDPNGSCINFFYSCDVCTPVIEALQAYARRESFYYHRKGDPLVAPETSLPADLLGLLRSADLKTRREGLEKLVSRFVEARFKLLRLTEAEAKPVRASLEDARKRGGIMRSPKGAELEKCPSCEGSVRLFRNR